MIRILLFIILLALGSFLWWSNPLFPLGLGMIMSILTALWLLSLVLKDASIIDIFWGFGFVTIAWFYYYSLDNQGVRPLLICGLVTIWGLRLSIHLAIRNVGKGEDYRYQAWREANGNNWWWLSFFRVFLLQGLILWIISSPLLLAMISPYQNLQVLDYVGVMLFSVGFFFEAIGDWQLTQFKKNPANKGKVLQTGLWGITRHPNYFGDALLWWGFFCFSLSNPSGWQYVFSPVFMTFLLMNVSGVALLEQKLNKTKTDYQEYREKVPAFFPKIW